MESRQDKKKSRGMSAKHLKTTYFFFYPVKHSRGIYDKRTQKFKGDTNL